MTEYLFNVDNGNIKDCLDIKNCIDCKYWSHSDRKCGRLTSVIKTQEHYCEDCKFKYQDFSDRLARVLYCSHILNLTTKKFDKRQKIQDRYPLCKHVNEKGFCDYFQQKRNRRQTLIGFFKDIIIGKHTFSNLIIRLSLLCAAITISILIIISMWEKL